jgi:hypothetical protein
VTPPSGNTDRWVPTRATLIADLATARTQLAALADAKWSNPPGMDIPDDLRSDVFNPAQKDYLRTALAAVPDSTNNQGETP